MTDLALNLSACGDFCGKSSTAEGAILSGELSKTPFEPNVSSSLGGQACMCLHLLWSSRFVDTLDSHPSQAIKFDGPGSASTHHDQNKCLIGCALYFCRWRMHI